MSLSAREQRILSEIEHELTAAEPFLSRALAGMRLGLRDRAAIGRHARPPRGGTTSRRWAGVMIAWLFAGVALISAGLVLDVLALVIVGSALTQLSLVAGWLARALSARRRAGH